jgi:AraC family transcriptional regulator of adaptative response/methylated-DNA-[protein]-cysteine methyltransferase
MKPANRSENDLVVDAALAYLEGRAEQGVPLAELAASVGLSPSHLQRKFKAKTGMSPKEYGTKLRLARFRGLVQAGDDVSSATYQAGFGSSRGLYETARASLGMTPGQVARKGAGVHITYTTTNSPFGRVLIGATSDGVCAVFLGDRDEQLLEDLLSQFSCAEITPGSLPAAWEAGVIDHLRDTHMPLAIPLDFRGTPFQVRVWKALREIPAGEQRTYSDIANAIGSPVAVRAVGTACGQNSIAVLIPCHRVTRKDGLLGGYRWGTARKRALLVAEGH